MATDYESLSLLQAVRRWPRITIYSVCLALNILLWGYDTAIVGNVASMPVFQRVFGEKSEEGNNEYIITSMWLALWAVAFPIGTMIGAAAGAWVQDRTGRKWTLAIGSVISVVAIAVCYIADLTTNKQATFWGGKLLEGLAVGVIMCSTQTYLSEVVPARLRGPVFALFPAFQLVGQLVAAVAVLAQLNVEGRKSYRIALASEWPFSAIPLVLAFVLPESPAWLLHKDKISSARDSFRKLHGEAVALAHQDLFEDMHRAVAEERRAANDRKATYMECFRGSNLKRTLIVVFANTYEELFGLTLLGHVSYFLQLVGLDHSASFIILILGVVLGLFANIGSFWTLLKFGRRLLILVTLAIIVVFWTSMGVAGFFKGPAVAYYSSAAMMAIVVTAGLGVWPASFIVRSETSSLRLRSKTSGLGWLIGGIVRCGFGLGAPFLYNTDAGDLGAKTGFVFAGTSLLALVITWFFVPELKGLSTTEIDRLFEKPSTGISRIGTGQWQRLESGDEMPLRSNELDRERTNETGESRFTEDSDSLERVKSAEPYEPLRKRPTF